MITLKSPHEIEAMRRAGRITSAARTVAGRLVKPGVTTKEIDKAVYDFITSQGAAPSFLNYNGFPASACVSVNDEIIHGIPGHRRLMEGDVVSVDVGAFIGGYHGDCAGTFACGKISDEDQRLIDVTRQSFFEGIKFAKEGGHLWDISQAIQTYVEANGFTVVREYVGHGIGTKMHEAPEVPNYVSHSEHPGRGPRLLHGMTLAIEPMVNAGGVAIKVMPDGWTVRTKDGRNAAHYENTIVICPGGADPEILTVPDIGPEDI
jgi:methionyl aminopeptidase